MKEAVSKYVIFETAFLIYPGSSQPCVSFIFRQRILTSFQWEILIDTTAALQMCFNFSATCIGSAENTSAASLF
jgi:hypothetical protein